jgi:hypothetical protein
MGSPILMLGWLTMTSKSKLLMMTEQFYLTNCVVLCSDLEVSHDFIFFFFFDLRYFMKSCGIFALIMSLLFEVRNDSGATSVIYNSMAMNLSFLIYGVNYIGTFLGNHLT